MLKPRIRRAFSLPEILVAVAIVAIVAATVFPTIKERMRTGNSNALATELANLAQGIQNYKSTVGRYPNKLDYLDALPAASPVDICGNALLATQKNAFVGPYITRVITAPRWYIVADDDSVDNVLQRNSVPTPGAPDVLWIDVLGVDPKTVVDLDLLIDGIAGISAGTLQYVAEPGSSNFEVKYLIPRKGC